MHTVHYRARIPIQCAEYMLSVSELETNHSTLTQTGLGSLGPDRPVGRLTGAVAWTGHAGAAGPTRRNRNRSGIARRVRVETAVADSRPRDVGPPRCPTRTESPGATAGPLRCGRAHVQIVVAPGGARDSRSAPDADERHGRHHPYSASCRPVTESRHAGFAARGG